MISITNSFALELSLDGFSLPFDPSMIESISIFSSLSQFLPAIEITINDKANIVSEFLALAGGETISIRFGVTEEEMQGPYNFTVDSITVPDVIMSATQGAIVQIRGLLQCAAKLFRPVMTRSFGMVKSSHAVVLMAQEMGINASVETTDDAQIWIQPGWTNAQMLRYLAMRAISARGHASYVYGIDKDKRLLFQSSANLYRQPVQREYRMASMFTPAELDDPEKMKAAIFGYLPMNRKELLGVTGGYGATIQYFDLLRKEYVEYPITPSDFAVDRKSPSQRTNILTVEEDPATRKFYIGRTDDNNFPKLVQARAYDQVYRRVGSALQMATLVRGDPTLRLGNKVTCQIKSPDPQRPINTVYSGAWVIEKIIDNISQRGYWTKLILSRDGINDGELGGAGLIATSGGK